MRNCDTAIITNARNYNAVFKILIFNKQKNIYDFIIADEIICKSLTVFKSKISSCIKSIKGDFEIIEKLKHHYYVGNDLYLKPLVINRQVYIDLTIIYLT